MVRTRHKADRLGIKYLIIKRQLQGASAYTAYHHIHLADKQIVQQRRHYFLFNIQMQGRHRIAAILS